MSEKDLMGTVYGEVVLPAIAMIPIIAISIAIICKYWYDQSAWIIILKALTFAVIIVIIMLLVWKYASIKKEAL